MHSDPRYSGVRILKPHGHGPVLHCEVQQDVQYPLPADTSPPDRGILPGKNTKVYGKPLPGIFFVHEVDISGRETSIINSPNPAGSIIEPVNYTYRLHNGETNRSSSATDYRSVNHIPLHLFFVRLDVSLNNFF